MKVNKFKTRSFDGVAVNFPKLEHNFELHLQEVVIYISNVQARQLIENLKEVVGEK